MNIEQNVSEVENRIGYAFKQKELLKQAITHSSFINELKINKWDSYQRLEYLGDAVLELSISEYLFHNHPDMSEGKMSKLRASMVCEQALAFCAKDIQLGEFILLGKGEESGGGRERNSIISDVFEAIVGAVYIDGGFEEAKKFVAKYVLEDIGERQLFVDSKSILQEMVQAESQSKLQYKLIGECGPEHNKEFEVAVYIDNQCMATAIGHNKKDAEQKAAYSALKELRAKKEEQE